MIRLLTESDRSAVTALLSSEPSFNLYMLGTLEKLGFDQDFCQFWGDFDTEATGQGALRGVINRYMVGWTVYGRADADWAALAQVLDAHPLQADRLQDNPGGTPSLLPYLRRYRTTKLVIEEVMELPKPRFRPAAPPAGVVVRRATIDDLEPLVTFYAGADDMSRTRAGVLRPLQDTRLWLAEEGGLILATALTNAETNQLAMIGGVYTQPAARGRGLSQAVCSALCQDLLGAGLHPVLYWGQPAAGAVYRKLGFHATGKWRAVWLEPA
ncbi:MAG: GNAT family N-acetyltransferase [Caldilineaceae bacterium]|nr:GNAT family N-acetyltransferase [Caldilineaceae bacterium]